MKKDSKQSISVTAGVAMDGRTLVQEGLLKKGGLVNSLLFVAKPAAPPAQAVQQKPPQPATGGTSNTNQIKNSSS